MRETEANTDVRPLKILHLLPKKEKQSALFDNLILGLNKYEFTQYICYLSGDFDDITFLEQNGYPTINLGMASSKLKRLNFTAIHQISSLIRKYNIDIVHCQRHKTTVYGAIAAWFSRTGAKVFTSVHGRNRTRNFNRKLTNYFLHKRISRIIAVSEAVRKDVLQANWMLPPFKVRTVFNGIDALKFSKTEDSHAMKKRLGLHENNIFLFGTIGRLSAVKGQDILIKAFAETLKTFPHARLMLTGKGNLEHALKDLACRLGVEKQVYFQGYRTDIPEILSAYDCFMLPSLSEGLPLSLLEAMCAEVPVIASNVGGIPEILDGFPPELRVIPSNQDALKQSMCCMLNKTEEERYLLGKNLHERVMERFTKEKMVSAMCREYLSAMDFPEL